jgi:hypothetical protein
MTTAHIGAHWGPRPQPVDDAVEKLQRLLTALADINECFTGWRDQAFSKKKALAAPIVTGRRDDLRGRLLGGLRPTGEHTADAIEGGGTSLSWWTAADDEAAAAVLAVRLGITTPKMGFNAVTLQLPDSGKVPGLYTPETGQRLVTTIIDIFQPDRANWLTRELERLQKEPDRPQPDGSVAIGRIVGLPAGWATFLRDGEGAGFDRAALPSTAQVERVGDGTLVTLDGDPANPTANDVLGVRAAMGYEVAAADDQAVQAPASSPLSATPGSASASGAPEAEVREPERPTATTKHSQPMPVEQPKPRDE